MTEIQQLNYARPDNNDIYPKAVNSNFDPLYHKVPKYDIYGNLVFLP
jgi:hypothetical protein